MQQLCYHVFLYVCVVKDHRPHFNERLKLATLQLTPYNLQTKEATDDNKTFNVSFYIKGLRVNKVHVHI
jgi:hypothetical protein